MTDYPFAASVAYDPASSSLLRGATFTFLDATGTPATIKDLSGSSVAQLTADGIGVVPGFLAVDASVGFLVNAAGVKLPVSSTWAQDPAQVRSAVQGAADAAARSAQDAAGSVGPLATAINALSHRVGILEQGGGGSGGSGGVALVPGTRTQLVILASDYGGAWPSPPRLTGDPSYSVTFRGPIDAPPPAPAGSAAGMQPGDAYDFTG